MMADDTVVLPAHYGCRSELSEDGVVWATLGTLRRVAPEFGIATEDTFVEAMRAGVKTPPPAYEDIVRAKLGLLAFSPEKAAEWEFGKNQCAASAARQANAMGGER
jgi:hypothetical protein